MKSATIPDYMLLPQDRPVAGTYAELHQVSIPGWALGYLTYRGLNQYRKTDVRIDYSGSTIFTQG